MTQSGIGQGETRHIFHSSFQTMGFLGLKVLDFTYNWSHKLSHMSNVFL